MARLPRNVAHFLRSQRATLVIWGMSVALFGAALATLVDPAASSPVPVVREFPGRTEVQVPLSWALTLRNQPEYLVRTVRALPRRGSDGTVEGYRVTGVRAGAPAAELGLRNGDIVRSVNGMPLRSRKEVAESLAALDLPSTNRTFEFDVRRGDQPHTLVVTFVPR